jgi:pseudomonalisin
MNASTLRNSPVPALAMTISLALAAVVAMTARASDIPAGLGAAVANTTVLQPGDVFTGVLPHTQPMHVVVALKLQNSDQLSSLVAAHQMLTPAQISANYAPTASQAQAVTAYLRQMGFTNVVIAPNRMLVSADGTADRAQVAFQTSFSRVQTQDGRTAFANNSDAHVPATLQGNVLSVIGLQNVYHAHTFAQRAADGGTPSIMGHNPMQFSSIYGGTGVPTAAGVTVGIIGVGDMSLSVSDLSLFTTNNKLASVATQVIYTGADSGDTSGTDEWSLDSQDIVGMSGGAVGQIIFYATPSFSDADLLADLNAAVTANVAKIINMSIGGCETFEQLDGTAAASDQIFQVAVAQGQTFSISSGDSGSNECAGQAKAGASWPSDSPYVVSVGGSALTASTTTWSNETVWTGAGGSPSNFEPMPSWQKAFLVPGTTRGLPDVAFDAYPYSGSIVYVNGVLKQYGGTSLAAPIFSAEWARVIAIKGAAVGFAAPQLYQLPTTVFHDITVGNNGSETAKVGYDFASGRGSMILSSLAALVGKPSPLFANFSVTSSGLGAKFTDHSTDSGGAITSRTWNFGDGGVISGALNPSHLYVKAGTFTVTESVGDGAGYLTSQTATVTIK